MQFIVILLLMLIQVTVYAAPIKREHQVYYDIDGSTPHELRVQMNQKGPLDQDKRYDANTIWNIKWRYQFMDYQGGCKLSNVRVTLDTTYTFPNWKNYSEASVSLKKQWDTYSLNLHKHESTIAANGAEAADEIEYLLSQFPVMATCDSLEVEANGRAQQIIKLTTQRDLSYNMNTRHGITQGAVFP